MGSAPANAAKPPPPEPLVITDVYPDPGAINVPLPDPPAALVTFNQPELLRNSRTRCELFARLINLNTGEDVTEFVSCQTGFDEFGVPTPIIMVIQPTEPIPGFTLFECGTTYEVIVGGKGRRAVKSLAREPISEVPEGVNLDGSVATWTFTTVPC